MRWSGKRRRSRTHRTVICSRSASGSHYGGHFTRVGAYIMGASIAFSASIPCLSAVLPVRSLFHLPIPASLWYVVRLRRFGMSFNDSGSFSLFSDATLCDARPSYCTTPSHIPG